MKKIFILAVLVMVVISANAQIQIGKKNDKVETLGSVRLGAISLKYGFGDYYISGSTTNQFDDPVIINLGKTIDQAKESFAGLLSLYELKNGETTTIKDISGHEWYVGKFGGVGKGTLSFDSNNEVQAGVFTIHRAEMVNLQKKLK